MHSCKVVEVSHGWLLLRLHPAPSTAPLLPSPTAPVATLPRPLPPLSQPTDRLSIGSKICRELLGKLLSDMANMREESMVTSWGEDEAGAQGAEPMYGE